MRISDWSSDVSLPILTDLDRVVTMDKAVPAQLPYSAASRVEAEPQLLVNVSNGTGEGLSACIPRRLSMKFTHHVIHAARVLGLAAEPSTMLFDEPAQIGGASCRERVCQYV